MKISENSKEMIYKYYPRNFKQFYPLNKLNRGIDKLDIFNRDAAKPLELGLRFKRFAACDESFKRNTIRLHRLLDSIANHFNISYNSKDRKRPYQYQFIKKSIHLENDLLLFFTIMKILLDDMAFFVPFYFRDALKYDKNIPDIRDAKRPPSFNGLKDFFFKNEEIDKEFLSILKANEGWTNEVCEIRNFLIHRFHDLSVHNDWWTHACYSMLYEFNGLNNFIPNILTYVARIYYSFVKFTKEFEEHFKNVCQEQFPEYDYFKSGHAYANGLGKTHLFFAGLGRLLQNNILIRIHEGQRNRIHKTLEYFMRKENVICNICNKFKVQIKPTIEQHVIISSYCDCGKSLPIPLSVEKNFYPFFMDQNVEHVIRKLISYETRVSVIKFLNEN